MNLKYLKTHTIIHIDTCYVEWEIIKRLIPVEWEISFCFPNCNPTGIVNGQYTFSPNQQGYLNAHIYPNNVLGEGQIEMKIVTNFNEVDTVAWNFMVSHFTSVENIENYYNSAYEIYDLNGKKVSSIKRGASYLIKFRNQKMKPGIIYIL